MFRFIKKECVVAKKFFGSNVLNVNPLKCVLMNNNQEFKVRLQMMNMNNNGPWFYRYNVKIIKCSGIWNNNNDSYAQLCVPDVVKNIYAKVINLVARTNETRHKE